MTQLHDVSLSHSLPSLLNPPCCRASPSTWGTTVASVQPRSSVIRQQQCELSVYRRRLGIQKALRDQMHFTFSPNDARCAIHMLIGEAARDDCARHKDPKEKRELGKKWKSVMASADGCFTDGAGTVINGTEAALSTLSCMYVWSEENVCREFVYVDPSAPWSYYAQRRMRMQRVLDALPKGQYFFQNAGPA